MFLSVDVPVLGKRLNEYRNEFRIPEDMTYPNILSSGADTSDRTDYGIFIVLVNGDEIADYSRSYPGLGDGDPVAQITHPPSHLAQRR